MKRRIPFDISLRPQIEAGEYLIEDKFGNRLTFKCVKDGLTYFTKRQEGANYDAEVFFDYPQRYLFLIENKEEDDFDRLLKEMIEDVQNGDYVEGSFEFWKNKLIESLSNQQSVIFKDEQIGRWIVNDDKRIAIPAQILGIEKYGFMTSRGYLSFAKVNKEFHVWTMKDAKDGDVLQLGNVTAIFKSTVADSANDCYCYCSIYANELQIPAETEEYGCHNAKPATKEQKEALLSKMKDEGYSFDFNINVLKKVKETEPKFKAGDWCIDNEDGTIFQIVKVLDNTYTYKTNKGEEYSCAHYSLEIDARLWTIQDAKDGDVLADNLPFIFKRIDLLQRSYAYCGISIYGFQIESEGELGEWTWMNDIKPATKEQCDILFQKMKEAGYEWDAEKKELKKIEQELTWNEKIKGLNELETYILSLVPNRSLDAIKVDTKNIRYIINKEQKVWNEEDEKLYISALWHIKNSCGNGGNDSGEYEVYNWLKSIRDRVQQQPKQEWSEEDEKILKHIDNLLYSQCTIHGSEYEKIHNWLKSIKHQNRWKPSEAQLSVLQTAIKDYGICAEKNVFETLYNDLKKL